MSGTSRGQEGLSPAIHSLAEVTETGTFSGSEGAHTARKPIPGRAGRSSRQLPSAALGQAKNVAQRVALALALKAGERLVPGFGICLLVYDSVRLSQWALYISADICHGIASPQPFSSVSKVLVKATSQQLQGLLIQRLSEKILERKQFAAPPKRLRRPVPSVNRFL